MFHMSLFLTFEMMTPIYGEIWHYLINERVLLFKSIF